MNHEFIGREAEIKRLSTNFIFQTSTVLLSPQGWGKTSLVRKAAADAAFKEKKFRLCHVALANARDEERFYELLAEGVIKAISVSFEDAVRNIGRLFGGLAPKFTFDTPTVDGIRLSFDWGELMKMKDEIIDLPHRVAKADGLKITVCLDDFHAVAEYPSARDFVAYLTDRWMKHEGVSYCICAVDLPVIEYVAGSRLFSRYGETVRLEKLDRVAFASYLKEKFAGYGKFLDLDNAELIVRLAGSHPFYVQRLADASFASTSVVCSREVVEAAHAAMTGQMHLAFTALVSSMTSQQLCYLHAILAGETVISTSDVLHRHHISSATSASRSKTALLERGILYAEAGKVALADPMFAWWLEHVYFENQ